MTSVKRKGTKKRKYITKKGGDWVGKGTCKRNTRERMSLVTP